MEYILEEEISFIMWTGILKYVGINLNAQGLCDENATDFSGGR